MGALSFSYKTLDISNIFFLEKNISEGELVVKLDRDYDINKNLIIPEMTGLETVIIKSDSDKLRELNFTNGAFFANGYRLIIDESVKVKGDIYGGSYNQDLSRSPKIEINGIVEGNIFGGSLNGTIGKEGNYLDTRILINNKVFDVYGGGHAIYEDANAMIYGSTIIKLLENARVNDCFGGGLASGYLSNASIYGGTGIIVKEYSNNAKNYEELANKKMFQALSLYYGGRAKNHAKAQVLNNISALNSVVINGSVSDKIVGDGLSDSTGDIHIFGKKQTSLDDFVI